jgi:uncharacterized membrane protein HdeD (DUF308 family)
MANAAGPAPSDRTRAILIKVAGIAIIALSAGAALLPAANGLEGSQVLGCLLVAGGAIELGAGMLRRKTSPFAVAAGSVTALAGLLIFVNPTAHFFPNVTLVVAWLLLRGIILAIASRRSGGSVRLWTSLSAGMDLLLAALLIAGLSIATIVVSLFGPTAPLLAGFAWFVAASFIVNGLLLLEVADCERASAAAPGEPA